jgi:hypothetical protein
MSGALLMYIYFLYIGWRAHFVPRFFIDLRIVVFFVCKHLDGTVDLSIYTRVYIFEIYVVFTCVLLMY